MTTQLPHENLNWITNGEPGTGSPDGSTPDGVLNRPIKQNLENIKKLRDTFNEEHTDSGQHETSMIKAKLESAITDDEIASNAHINESKVDLLLKGKTRPGGGTYSNSGELADDVLSWVTLRNQVPTRAEFESFAERVRRAMAGSGFVEWGGVHNWYDIRISRGMWVTPIDQNGFHDKIGLGSEYYWRKLDGSRTAFAIVNINGHLMALRNLDDSYIKSVYINFPSPPSSPDQLYRQDLVFLECWHEDVSEKDIVFPYGNVQYGADSYASLSTTPITDLGIDQGYSAFGSWDTETVGRGIRWSELTEEQKKSFASDPWNNIYVDGDKVIQVRYRIRVADCVNAYDSASAITSEAYVQGKNNSISSSKFSAESVDVDAGLYKYNSTTYSYNGVTIAIPIALVARRNTGAFHPVYNPNGSALFSGSKKFWEVSIPTPTSYNIVGVNIEDTNEDGTNDLFQFIVSGDQTENIKKDYFITVSGSTDNDGRYWVTNVEYDSDNDQTVVTVSYINEIPSTTADGSLYSDFGYVKYCFDHADASSGTIDSGVSGRPDGLYADEINEGDVRDLRNYAPRVTDYQRVSEKEFNKLLEGKMRGWEGLPIIFKGMIWNDGIEGHRCLWPARSKIHGTAREMVSSCYQQYPVFTSWPLLNGRLIWNETKGHLKGLDILAMNNYDNYFVKWSDPSLYDDGDEYMANLNFHYFSKNLLMCDICGNIEAIYDSIQGSDLRLGWFRPLGDYTESFILTDDFSATVDSTDNTKITISGDKRYAIRKNCRLFFRDSTNNKAGTLRVKTISYDSGNDQTVLTTTVESGDSMVAGASVNVSTCIASGQTGEVSEGNQVYVFKLSRKPKNNEVKVLIRKKDGSWFAFNSFDNVNVYNSSSMQSFVNNTGSMDEEIQFNSYLNWLALNISKIYSTLGYSDEDDFKQNAVIEVYYVTKANPLKLSANLSSLLINKLIEFSGFGDWQNSSLRSIDFIGKVVEKTWSAGDNKSYMYTRYVPINNGYTFLDQVYYAKADFPSQISGKEFGLSTLCSLYKSNGKLCLYVYYNEILHDYETDSKGWEGTLYVPSYENTSTDANGNTFIAGQKLVELPYFVWTEDK